ncbi:hypothetical protein E5S67_06144 [Microcoleus sp. IPMA8]|uniref:Uncharacterized protein n=1 Tax=Microcoleus asticus IPMA8 TaxID=2563858 RepID=A0ABX2D6T9_9CYAN|nr:hypothetical protein [Microcoleus asticus IPMA8]
MTANFLAVVSDGSGYGEIQFYRNCGIIFLMLNLVFITFLPLNYRPLSHRYKRFPTLKRADRPYSLNANSN